MSLGNPIYSKPVMTDLWLIIRQYPFSSIYFKRSTLFVSLKGVMDSLSHKASLSDAWCELQNTELIKTKFRQAPLSIKFILNKCMPWIMIPHSHLKKTNKKRHLETKQILKWNYSSFFIRAMKLQCNKNHTRSLSIAIWTDWICGLSWDPSLIVTEVAMTGRDTPHARPRACLERTNTYGTFLSSHRSGRWRMISSGSASAAITINSAMPLFRVLVAAEQVDHSD